MPSLNRKTSMTFGSLFAGIGGMDLGLERAGMVCRWQVEINPFARQILDKHWPHVPKYGDIRELTGAELEPVDLICGGFPCQDVSLAGLRKGIGAGTRSGLYADMLRIVVAIRPRYVLMENVAGLLTPIGHGQPAPIARVLGDLAEIGFDAEWRDLPASEFGAEHRRSRIFIVAYASGKRSHAVGDVSGIIEAKRPERTPDNGFAEVGDVQRAAGIRAINLRDPDGLRRGMDRIKAAGNAIAPPVAEWIGRQITQSSADDHA